MALFCLVLLILVLAVMLSADTSEETDRLPPHETIQIIGTQARREGHDLSEEFLRRAIDILNQSRR
jgi:hypothetical protein